jgi:transcriptional regulator with XRE-family HTH domain
MDQRTISYLRPLRRRWGLTQAELASLIGTRTHVAISRIEALKIYPSLAEAIACSIIFDTPPIELFPELYAKVYEFVILFGFFRATMFGDASLMCRRLARTLSLRR